MSTFHRQPVREKETHAAETRRWTCGLAATEGYRIGMEDAHCIDAEVAKDAEIAFFGVFDGHCGKTVSTACGTSLLSTIRDCPSFKRASEAGFKDAALLQQALLEGFAAWDEQLASMEELKSGEDKSGSTAVVCFVTPWHVVVANLGDSRLVISTADHMVKFATVDHKAENETELRRIEAAGGFVEMNRVNGDLGVARAFGDFSFKQVAGKLPGEQLVSSVPDVSIIEQDAADPIEFIVLACDGIWDAITSDEAIGLLRTGVITGTDDPVKLAGMLVDESIDRWSRDNLSACVIRFKTN